MMLRLVALLISYLCIYSLQAQGEANNWYFGDQAGITFNGGAPGSLTTSAMNSFEGCSTMSDSTGNLLFYSNGVNVWDRSHTIMPNGSGLLGDPSTTQSGIIVPHPGNSNLFYIFSLDARAGVEGLRYSVIDMSLNAGLGDVTAAKNILLYTPTTEKITVVTHANGNDIWVVTHKSGTNEFLSYLIDNSGINTTPIICAVGFSVISSNDNIGYMKISPDGRKIASAYHDSGILEILEFNPIIGLVSNPIQISGFNQIYGVEFSPNGQQLYISAGIGGIFQFDLSNFNRASIIASMTSINPTPSPPASLMTSYGALQLGPDRKIYVSHFGYNYLGVINNPDLPGNACDYQFNGVFLRLGVCQYGLPSFIPFYFSSNIIVEDTCLGDVTEFLISSNQTIDSINWDFGDGNSSVLTNPTHTFLTAGTFNVSTTISSGGQVFMSNTVVITYEQPIATAPQNVLICDNNNDGFFDFDLTIQDPVILNGQSAAAFEVVYYESILDYNNNAPIAIPTAYTNTTAYGAQTITASVRNRNNSECEAITSFDIQIFESPFPAAVTPSIEICDNTSVGTDVDGLIVFDLTINEVTILNGQSAINFELQYFTDAALSIPIANPANYQNSNPTETIYVQMANRNYTTCAATTSFDIEVFPLPTINDIDQLEQCDDPINDGFETFDLTTQDITFLNGQSAVDHIITYHLHLNDAQQGVSSLPTTYTNTSNPQTIFVRVENTNNSDCYAITSFDMVVYEQPVVLMKEEWTICENDSVVLIADAGFDNYLWSTGETTESITVSAPGNYSVTVSNDYGIIICEETKDLTVIESAVAVITNIEIEDWSQDNNSVFVKVQGTGDYEYSLDGTTYQESNRFDNLLMGDYQIYVRDKNGCGIVVQDIYLLFYPRFFTPNADGFHDSWQLYNSNKEPLNQIYIFDRYGKLLKQISPEDIGWDGTYNGTPLPSSDYWFVVERSNGKSHRGHFTLKR